MDKPILYSTGYLGDRTRAKVSKVAAFDAMVGRLNLLVCDIRLNPYSKAQCWRKAELAKRLGAGTLDCRYLHVQQLGNRNYKSGGPVSIIHLPWGVETILKACAATGLDPLLLCGCEDYECCHRQEVGRAFAGKAEQWFEITNWENPADLGRDCAPRDVLGVDLTHEWAKVSQAVYHPLPQKSQAGQA